MRAPVKGGGGGEGGGEMYIKEQYKGISTFSSARLSYQYSYHIQLSEQIRYTKS